MAHLTAVRLADEFVSTYTPTSRETRTAALRRWLAWCTANRLDPLNVAPAHVIAFRRGLIEHHNLTTTTAAGYVSSIGLYYDYAIAHGHLDTNPTAHIPKGGKPRLSTGSWLTRAELRTLLTVSHDAHPDFTALTHLLALNGLRIHEALAILTTGVGTHDGTMTVTIPHRKHYQGPHTVAVSDPTANTIRPLLTRRATGYLIRIPRRRGTGPGSRKYAAERYRDVLHRMCVDNDLPPITPHGLRRTFITLAIEAGVPEHTIMAAAGITTRQTLVYYDRAFWSVARNATHALTEWLDL